MSLLIYSKRPYQSPERPLRKFKALKNKFKAVKILYFFFDSQLTGQIQNTAISKHFTKPIVYTRTTSGTIFSADVWISGGQVIFQCKPGANL